MNKEGFIVSGIAAVSRRMSTVRLESRRAFARFFPLFFLDAVHYNLRRKNKFSELDLLQKSCLDFRSGLMIDVGAHYGGSLLPFLAKGWRVIAFEPDKNNRAQLLRNLGGRKRLKIYNTAVGEKEAEGVPFFSSDKSSGISSVIPFDNTHERQSTVAVTTLARVAEVEGLEAVDLLKIDTEGNDLFVIKGMPRVSSWARVLLTEYEDAKTEKVGYTGNELAEHLEALGYKLIISEWEPIKEYGGRHSWRGFKRYAGNIGSDSWGNIIAFSKENDLAAFLSYANDCGHEVANV